ncbi:hypothetical protein TSOC_003464 [Tetrabaena socialis]|uniref:Uncharacterized protein n=1 Tax=Tetrabaena socialis TaxID=47790 RepID=A0A2J8ABG1_9CHLO|nr:hypothetical protein TSOC_003464 [Tetrabaena socialis]|eukprot:PNH09864.1 hypothetical protein TSOC_003464 [Tetrabaena socialis]
MPVGSKRGGVTLQLMRHGSEAFTPRFIAPCWPHAMAPSSVLQPARPHTAWGMKAMVLGGGWACIGAASALEQQAGTEAVGASYVGKARDV